MKVLFGHHGLRGDLVINLPAVRYLVEAYGWTVDIPIHERFADMVPLFLNHPYLNSVFITKDYERFSSDADAESLRRRGYDRVFSPMHPHLMERWFEHMHQTELVLADYVGARLPESFRQIELTKWFDLPDLNLDRPAVAFAPFAGFESNPNNDKRLSLERANQIAEYVMDKGFEVFHLGGPGEPRLDHGVRQTGSYFDSVKAMLACKALIHTDTGMGWIASAYQHPQLGLYGHRYYGADHVKAIQPVNPNALYLDAPTVADIPWDQIASAIDRILS